MGGLAVSDFSSTVLLLAMGFALGMICTIAAIEPLLHLMLRV